MKILRKNRKWQEKKLTRIFMFYITIIITLIMFFNIAWTIRAQQKANIIELKSKAKVITDQFLSMRSFIAQKQDRINFDSQGNFEFKALNPAAVGKGVEDIFNKKTDYKLKQTTFSPRNPENKPDQFEKIHLQKLAAEPAVEYVWGEETISEQRFFRYMVPLYMELSCLECHGQPAGEIDISGYPKEGLTLNDFAGALSIAIPADSYYTQLKQQIIQTFAFYLSLLILSLLMIYFLQRRLVTAPLEKLANMSQTLSKGDFSNVNLMSQKNNKDNEIAILETSFHKMAQDLGTIYSDLEEKVTKRTYELSEEKNKLEQVIKELENLNKLQSEFLTNVSHELRTPITCILAFAELMEDNQSLSEEEKLENLKDIQQSGQSLLYMINNLLDAAKLDIDRLKLEKSLVDLKELSNLIMKQLSPLAQEKQLFFEKEIAQDLPQLICDKNRIRQVLINLLGNAIKFTPKKGTVRLKVECKDSKIYFYVEDTGAGIPSSLTSTIFERFRQGEELDMKSHAGSGLGLYIAKEFVNLHDGEIGLYDNKPSGTVFYFYIPLLKDEVNL